MIVDVSSPLEVGRRLGFEAPGRVGGPTIGFTVTGVAHARARGDASRQAIETRDARRRRVARGSHVGGRAARARAGELRGAAAGDPRSARRASTCACSARRARRSRRCSRAAARRSTVRSEITLVARDASARSTRARCASSSAGWATRRSCSAQVDSTGLARGPVPSRERAESPAPAGRRAADCCGATGRARRDRRAPRAASKQRVATSASRARRGRAPRRTRRSRLARAGLSRRRRATPRRTPARPRSCFDPFLRHPAPPVARVRALRERLARARRRAPPAHADDRASRGARRAFRSGSTSGCRSSSGHLGLVAELARAGRDVVADYAVNVLQRSTPRRELFALGARRIVASVELTTGRDGAARRAVGGRRLRRLALRPPRRDDDRALRAVGGVRPRADDVPRSVRAEAPERRSSPIPPATQFAVATDSACRNRLLHSRPVEGSEYPAAAVARRAFADTSSCSTFRAIRVAGDRRGYRAMLDALAAGVERRDVDAVRRCAGAAFTRGHFARAV